MTTKKYADFIEKQTRSIHVSAEPIFGEYILRINGKKIGVLYQNQCYLFLTVKGKELLPDAKVCRPYKNPPGEKDFILVENTDDEELLSLLFKETYNELHAWQDLMCELSGHFTANSRYMEHIELLYDEFVVLLSFCWDNNFLKIRPVDTKGRILKFEFRRNDLTPDGEKFFESIFWNFISYTARAQKIPSEKLMSKWLNEVKTNKIGR